MVLVEAPEAHRRVERHRHGAGIEGAEEGVEEPGRRGQDKADAFARPHAAFDQPAPGGQCPLVDLRPGDELGAFVTIDEPQAAGAGFGGAGEEVHHALGSHRPAA